MKAFPLALAFNQQEIILVVWSLEIFGDFMLFGNLTYSLSLLTCQEPNRGQGNFTRPEITCVCGFFIFLAISDGKPLLFRVVVASILALWKSSSLLLLMYWESNEDMKTSWGLRLPVCTFFVFLAISNGFWINIKLHLPLYPAFTSLGGFQINVCSLWLLMLIYLLIQQLFKVWLPAL